VSKTYVSNRTGLLAVSSNHAGVGDMTVARLVTPPRKIRVARSDIAKREMTFVGGSRWRAIAELLRAVGDGDILTLLTGISGVGKSAALNAALQVLAETQIKVFRLTNPGGLTWTLHALSDQLLGKPVETLTDLAVATAVSELTDTIDDEPSIVITVDDAQSLTDEAMEFLLLLASPARRQSTAIQLILVGCGDFWKRDWRSELQLITSLAACVTIDPFAGADGGHYISWCLNRVEGTVDYTITPDAAAIILRHSGGFPENIAPVLTASISIATCRRESSLTKDVVEAAIDSLAIAPEVPDAAISAIMTVPSVGDPDGTGPRTGVAPVARPVVPDAVPQPAVTPAWTKLRVMSDVVTSADAQRVVSSRSPRIGKSSVFPPIVAPRFKRPVRAAAAVASIIVLAATGFALLRDDAGDRAAAAIDWLSLQRPAHLAHVLWNSTKQASAAANSQHAPAVLRPGHDVPVQNELSSDERPRVEEKATSEPVVAGAVGEVVSVTGADSLRLPTEELIVAANVVTAPEVVSDHAAVTPPEPSNSGRTELVAAEAREAIELKVEQQAQPSADASVPIASGSAEVASATSVPVVPPNQRPADSAPAVRVIALAATARTVPDRPDAASPGIAQPAVAALALAAASPPHPVVTNSLPPAKVISLLRRADTLLQQGDVLTARLFYERAAAAGSGEGATGAGKTYDPGFLATIDAPGLRGDVARAIEWYRTAAVTLGDREAGERLRALTGR
jgi:type II secretory pathway predicted ATPase ExeA